MDSLVTPLHTYQLCLAIFSHVLKRLNGTQWTWKKKHVENYQTHSSRVSFKTKKSVTCDKSYLFSVFVGAEILQSLLFVLTLHIGNSAISTWLYPNYPLAKYISRVKNACTDFFINWLHKERYHRWWFTL